MPSKRTATQGCIDSVPFWQPPWLQIQALLVYSRWIYQSFHSTSDLKSWTSGWTEWSEVWTVVLSVSIHFHWLRDEAVGVLGNTQNHFNHFSTFVTWISDRAGDWTIACRFEMIEMVRVRIPYCLNIEKSQFVWAEWWKKSGPPKWGFDFQTFIFTILSLSSWALNRSWLITHPQDSRRKWPVEVKLWYPGWCSVC